MRTCLGAEQPLAQVRTGAAQIFAGGHQRSSSSMVESRDRQATMRRQDILPLHDSVR
jgi:hypothetical protein